MITVSALNNTAAGTAATAAKTDNTLGQDQFLTLLVAQLQNQDPLNPTDATEFTAQLAQYSQLEQLFNLNDAMDGLTAAQTSSQKVSALSLIGKEVVVEDTHFPFDGAPTRIGYRVDGPATDISLQIRNSAGATVATLNAGDTTPGEHFLTWNGLDQNGAPLPADTYQLAVTAKGASADATEASTKASMLHNSTGRRPKRSESGPRISWPAPKPSRYTDSVSCAPALSVCSARAMAGSAGR